jgi:xylene monooxygenase electron transfer component
MAMFRREPREVKTVTLAGTGKSFVTSGRDSVLNDALDAGIPFPHSCTVGTCGTCKVKLLSGKVRELSDSANILSAEELRERYVLACQSVARSSIELDVAGLADMPDHPLLRVEGEIVLQRPLTHDIVEIGIRLDGPLAYTAGQYAELTVPGRLGPRAYSFALGARRRDKDYASFFCRLVPGGDFTEWLFAQDRTGTRLTVAGPFGNLWLRPGSSPVLCVAGGSGLAPIKALLEDAHDAGVDRNFTLVFGARTERDLYCLTETAALREACPDRFTFLPVLSEESEDSSAAGGRGLVTDVIAGLAPDFLADCAVYACGPPPMVDAVERQLGALRGEDAPFYADRFLDRSSRADR